MDIAGRGCRHRPARQRLPRDEGTVCVVDKGGGHAPGGDGRLPPFHVVRMGVGHAALGAGGHGPVGVIGETGPGGGLAQPGGVIAPGS